MSVMTSTLPIPGPEPRDDEPIWPISVAMYQDMIRLGVIDEKSRVYLWKGRLAERMPPNPPHSDCVKEIYDLLKPLLPPGYDIDRERPMALRLSPSAPQPDITVIRGRFRDFAPAFFTTGVATLLVEVADTTLAKDRRLVATYATEVVPVYWLVNFAERQVEVYSNPIEGTYATQVIYKHDAEIPVILDGREVGRIRVADLLP